MEVIYVLSQTLSDEKSDLKIIGLPSPLF